LGAPTRETFLDSYLNEGRSVSLNLLFTLPLLLLYEIGIQRSGSDLRNAAEVILKDLRLLMGDDAVRWFHWFLFALVVVFCLRAFSKGKPVFLYFGLMIIESVLLAFVLGPLLAMFIGTVLLDFPLTGGQEPDLSVRILLSVGAGVYEELLFRFFILGGLFMVFLRVFQAPPAFGAALAVVISAFLFAAYHHLGPYGQELTPYPFLFRIGAGLVLGAVFITRGLGVAVYLHVFYDVLRDIELTLSSG
jgi:membrane protease YdiL (CAAX protease family)